MEFDENIAVKHINDSLIKRSRAPYPDDEILNIIDMIWDYYEENGLLEIDPEDEDDIASVEELTDYVSRMLKKDKQAKINPDDIQAIIEAELEYEDSLDSF